MTNNEGGGEVDELRTPLRGKYLVRHPILNALLRIVDGVLTIAVVKRFGPSKAPPRVPRRILLANGAHLGDVLIFSSVIQALNSAFPGIEIGVVIGSWARPIVAANPMIKWVHEVDHWMLNRSKQSLVNRISRYLRTRSHALEQIREINYDVAIDFYYYFPNILLLLWQSKIPVRIGYGSGGFGPLLTHEASWVNKDCHVVDYHRSLLRFLNPPEETIARLRPPSPPVELEIDQKLQSLLRETGSVLDDYILFHIGTGHSRKEWPTARWRALAVRFIDDGLHVVFTGTGAHEDELIGIVSGGLPGCTNLSGKLSWSEYVAAIAHARLTVCVDSLAGHLAAAVDTPCVVIKTGISHVQHWRPLSDRCEVLTEHVVCSPCYRSDGCSTMECILGVQVSRVYDACKRVMTTEWAA